LPKAQTEIDHPSPAGAKRNRLLSNPGAGKIIQGQETGGQGTGMAGRSVALAFALVLTGAVPALAFETADKFQHEGWSGQAVFQDGKFRQCHMWMAAINNWDLGPALEPSGEMRLGLRARTIDQFWQMLFGQKTALRIQGPAVSSRRHQGGDGHASRMRRQPS